MRGWLLLLCLMTISAKQQRIASTALVSDEVLDSLIGIADRRIVAISNLAANSLYSNIYQLPSANNKRVANIEQLVTLRPDLVISTIFNRPSFIKVLAKLSIGQFASLELSNFANLDDIFANVLTIGKAIGEPERADKLFANLQGRLRRLTINQDKRRPRLINFFADNTLMGRDTLFEAIVNCAGGVNVAGTLGFFFKGFQVASAEVLASLTVDYIVVPTGIYQADKIAPLLKQRIGWRNLSSAKLIFVPARQLLATSHHVLTACEKIHAVIHK